MNDMSTMINLLLVFVVSFVMAGFKQDCEKIKGFIDNGRCYAVTANKKALMPRADRFALAIQLDGQCVEMPVTHTRGIAAPAYIKGLPELAKKAIYLKNVEGARINAWRNGSAPRDCIHKMEERIEDRKSWYTYTVDITYPHPLRLYPVAASLWLESEPNNCDNKNENVGYFSKFDTNLTDHRNSDEQPTLCVYTLRPGQNENY